MRRIVTLLFLLVMAVLVARWWTSELEKVPVVAVAPSVSYPKDKLKAASWRNHESFDLPPPDSAVLDVQGSLRKQAAAGNPAAGCRLAMELLRCHGYRKDQQILSGRSRMPVDADAERRASMEKMYADTRQRVDELREVCDGVAPGSESEAWRLLLEAGKSGHVPSMLKFATRQGVMGFGGDEFDLERFAAYRMYALPFLTDAAATGDPRAFLILGYAYLRPGQGTRAIPHDPVRGLAYLKAAARNLAPSSRAEVTRGIEQAITQEKIGPADQLRAEQLALELEPPLSVRAPQRLPGPEAIKARANFGCLGVSATQ
jgi:hypothetical protein